MELYIYEGPVTSFGKILDPLWYGQTRASSVDEAERNLKYQFKQQAKMMKNTNIKFTGKVLKK